VPTPGNGRLPAPLAAISATPGGIGSTCGDAGLPPLAARGQEAISATPGGTLRGSRGSTPSGLRVPVGSTLGFQGVPVGSVS